MALIIILISLAIERFLGSMEELRRSGWFIAYSRWASARLAQYESLNGPVGLLLILLPLIVPVMLLVHYLSGIWLLVGVPFSILVLLYCFGPRDLEAEVEAFVDARRRGDEESACWHANVLLGEEDEVDNSAELTKNIMENIFVEANERLLAVIFWFVMLGPAGALLYRLSSLIAPAEGEEPEGVVEAGMRLHQLLVWVPARFCAIAYALAGSFVEALHNWRQVECHWYLSSRQVLIAAGFGALRMDISEIEEDSTACDQIIEAMAMVRRAVLVSLSIIAMLTLAGWMG
ncbi:MAG: regulatory signaling modulator protein AmpE [Chromatiales bacterium]|nr:regulatory signaling modulator protein AmpE [Chromatiales bacterium]